MHWRDRCLKKKYSDYERVVYGYLKNYHVLKGQADSITKEIENISAQTNSLYDAKVARYGHDAGGGFDELSPAERKFAQKQKLDEKLYNAKINLQNVALAVWRVNNALNYLADVPRKIIEGRFIDRKSLLQVSIELGYSERTCQRILRGAIAEMTNIIFPESATEPHLDFVFLRGFPNRPQM